MSPRTKTSKSKKPVIKRVVRKKTQPAPPVQPDISKQIKEEFSVTTQTQKPAVTSPEVTVPAATNISPSPLSTAPKIEPKKEFVPVQYPADNTDQPNSIWKIIGILFFITMTAAIMYLIYSPQKKYIPPRVVTTIPTRPMQPPTITPTYTPAPIDISAYKIAILNGSGKSGVAGQMKTDLEAVGLTVSYIGNAPKKQLQTTIYLAPQTPSQLLETIQIAVSNYKETYMLPPLPATETADVIVILGSE